jgi:lysophospholipase L1-like esterase
VITTWRRRAAAVASLFALAAGTLVAIATSSATAMPELRWTGTWASALTAAPAQNTGGSLVGFNNQSVRMVVHTSVGGQKVRIRLSNAFGADAITVGRATVGLPVAAGSPDLVAGSVRTLTFSGSESVLIVKGSDVVSDPVDFEVEGLQDLAVSLFFPTPTGQTTWHWTSRETAWIYDGDRAADTSGSGFARTRTSFYFLAGVDVASHFASGSVVVLGDSISDGFMNTFDANHRWPDELAKRIVQTMPDVGDPGVLNESLSGNQVTRDGLNFAGVGTSALARLDTDVFGQTGVRAVIIELGVNDIHISSDSPERIITGLRQLTTQLHEKGIQVLVCTIGPFEGYPTWTPDKEVVRAAVNEFLRGSHNEFDTLVDMDAVFRDPAAPTKMRVEFDSGDHIHPNDTGASALAAAVPLWTL